MWTLRMLNGNQAGSLFELQQGRNIIGRGSDCHIQIKSHAISKHHAEIEVSGKKLTVRDLRSRNGTYVNGRLLSGRQLLNANDEIGSLRAVPLAAPAPCQ